MKNWRLTSEVIAFVSSSTKVDKDVYLASPGKVKYKTLVKKIIPDLILRKELNLLDNTFELKFNKDLQFFIKSDELPSPDWYKVNNPIVLKDIGLLLTEIPNNNGEFNKIKFEPIFLEDSPEISFTTENMSNYNICFEEMRRRINCEVCSKTKKRIIGHRYDTLDKSYIYLGNLYSRKKDPDMSEYLTDISEMPEVEMYVKYIKPTETCIEDIFNNRIIGTSDDDIIAVRKQSLMVDSGKVIDGNIIFNQDVIEQMLHKSIYNIYKEKEYNSVYNVFTNLSFLPIDPTSLKTIDLTKFKDEVCNYLEYNFKELLLTYWDFSGSKFLNKNNSTETNINDLTTAFFLSILDKNALKESYYTKLINDIGLNITDLTTEVLNSWEGDNLLNTFDNFIKYKNIRKVADQTVMLRTNKSLDYNIDIVSISSIFGEGNLKNIVIDMINNSIKTFGLGVTNYSIIQTGTKRNPKKYTKILLTADDIIDYIGEDSISDDIKTEIVNHKISNVFVEFDEDSIIN